MIGTRIAHYEITAHLGSGGMGDVCQATDTKLGRSVATQLYMGQLMVLVFALEHGSDIRMIQRCQQAGFTLESRNTFGIVAERFRKELD